MTSGCQHRSYGTEESRCCSLEDAQCPWDCRHSPGKFPCEGDWARPAEWARLQTGQPAAGRERFAGPPGSENHLQAGLRARNTLLQIIAQRLTILEDARLHLNHAMQGLGDQVQHFQHREPKQNAIRSIDRVTRSLLGDVSRLRCRRYNRSSFPRECKCSIGCHRSLQSETSAYVVRASLVMRQLTDLHLIVRNERVGLHVAIFSQLMDFGSLWDKSDQAQRS